jgi:hypothetical protein
MRLCGRREKFKRCVWSPKLDARTAQPFISPVTLSMVYGSRFSLVLHDTDNELDFSFGCGSAPGAQSHLSGSLHQLTTRSLRRRLVDGIYPAEASEGIVQANLAKLTYYAVTTPRKLPRIGKRLEKRVRKVRACCSCRWDELAHSAHRMRPRFGSALSRSRAPQSASW